MLNKLSSGGINKPQNVRNLLAISSGKGGVGKTTITLQLAMHLHQKGIKVGILDADIYGPNILAFSKHETINKLEPAYFNNIPVMSMSMLVSTEQALMWRGPMIAKAAMQLALDTKWPDLDILLVDFPPGTGDVHLSLLTNLAWIGYILVTTSHIMAQDEAIKVQQLFEKYNINMLAKLYNLTHISCQNCGHNNQLLGNIDEDTHPEYSIGYNSAWTKGEKSQNDDYIWADAIFNTIQNIADTKARNIKKINIAIKEQT